MGYSKFLTECLDKDSGVTANALILVELSWSDIKIDGDLFGTQVLWCITTHITTRTPYENREAAIKTVLHGNLW